MKIMGIYNELHPGITMHKIPVKAGFPGVLFTIGMAAVFLMGIPALKYFLIFAIALGIGFAVMLRFIPRQAGFVAFVFTAVVLVYLIGIPAIDEWRGGAERDFKDLSAWVIFPPPPPPTTPRLIGRVLVLPFRCDCNQRKPKQPCGSTNQRGRKAKKVAAVVAPSRHTVLEAENR